MNKDQAKQIQTGLRTVAIGQFAVFGAGYFKGDTVSFLSLAGAFVVAGILEYTAYTVLGRWSE